MATIKRFEQIEAWQRARELVQEVYRASSQGPLRRDFGLRDQLSRAAVSSMSNIAEGFARKTDKEFARFLDVARGSAIEVQSLLYVALDMKYITAAEFRRLYDRAEETVSLISGFTSYLRRSRDSGLRTPDSETTG